MSKPDSHGDQELNFTPEEAAPIRAVEELKQQPDSQHPEVDVLKATFTYSIEDCPTAEELMRYRERKLSRKREEDITYHLTFCDMCERVLVTAQETHMPETLCAPEGFMEQLNQALRES